MKHTCSYLQWNLSIDWNPVSIKYQIHKTIIKICTTLHLRKKKDWMNLSIFWTHLEPGLKIYLWKKPLWYSPWTKLEKVRGKTGKPKVSVSLPPALTGLHAEKLAGYFHSSQSQGNRTSGSEITVYLKSTKFNSVKTLTKTSKRKLRNQVSKTSYSW